MSDADSDSIPEFFIPLPENHPEPIFSDGGALVVVGDLDCYGEVELPPGELSRAIEIKHHDSRRRFLAGRRLIRGTVAPLIGVRPDLVPLAIADTGKPYLTDGAEGSVRVPYLALAHSGDLVVTLLSTEECGIDLEREDRRGPGHGYDRCLDPVRLSERFFSQEESLFLAQLDKRSREESFFTLWTCREAAIKADGRGLAALLSSTRVLSEHLTNDSDARGDVMAIPVQIGGDTWQALPWRMHGRYHAAIAFKDLPHVIHWRDLR